MPGQEKSEGAFRTIREVADWLGVPTHVLRFWESKFDQIAPVKGAGGRRYYRPDDMRLLGGIKVLLHDQGLTIRGVSLKIDEDGVEAVTAMSPALEAEQAIAAPRTRRVVRPMEEAGTASVVPLKPKAAPEKPELAAEAAPAAPPPDPDPMPEPIGTQPDAPVPPTAPMPDQPDQDPLPDQPTETRMPDQPGDDTAAETDLPQPGDAEAAMDVPPSDPQPVVEPLLEPGPDSAVATAPTEAEPRLADGVPKIKSGGALNAGERRRLRRIVRKLRGLIEEVEAELGPDARH